jgi:hypothetical protein
VQEMLKTARSADSLGEDVPHQDVSTILFRSSSRPETSLEASTGAGSSFDIAACELVRRFVEHLAAQNPAQSASGLAAPREVDWGALAAAVAKTPSLEQAIGRAVVLAHRMYRVELDDAHLGVGASGEETDQPFFAFSVADVTPDFGDNSRYRTKVAKRVSRFFAGRRQLDRSLTPPLEVSAPACLGDD